MEIHSAAPKDAEILSKLTMLSKAHWGYSQEQMDQWREELTITPDYISKHQVFLIKSDNQIIGYYAYCKLSVKEVELDNLFIHPEFMGQGLGKILMNDLLDKVQASGYQKITLYADPNAESFYKNYGFNTVDQLASSVPGRTLPVMEFVLNR